MFFKEKNQLPFEPGKKIKLSTEERGYHNTSLERLKKNKNFIVKRLAIREIDGSYPYFSEEEFQRHYGNNLKILKNFLPQYLPEIMLVYGKDETGGATGFMFTPEIIQPKKLTEEQVKNQSEQLDNFLVNLIEMWQNNNTEIADFNQPGNLLYGHTKQDQALKPYLVDIYPLVKYDNENFKKKIDDFMLKYPAGEFTVARAVLAQLNETVKE